MRKFKVQNSKCFANCLQQSKVIIQKLQVLPLLAVLVTLIVSPVYASECVCPKTEGGYNGCQKGTICNYSYTEPTHTCAVCPGASCSGDCGGGGGGGGNPPPPPQPPPMPGSFSISTTKGCQGPNPYINLSWSASSNAVLYKVVRSGSVLSTSSSTSYKDSGVSGNQTYSYLVYAYSGGGSHYEGPVSVVAPTCDVTTPTVKINWISPSTCFTPAYWRSALVQPITIHVDDVHNASGNAVVSAGIASVYATFHSLESGTDSARYIASLVKINTDGSFEYELTPLPFQPSFLTTLPAPRHYILTAYASDNASHTGNSTGIQFQYDNICTPPHIQTQNGDVHSQGTIKSR